MEMATGDCMRVTYSCGVAICVLSAVVSQAYPRPATAPSGKAMSALVDGLGVNGTMVVVGASMDPIEVAPNQLLFGKKGIKGWAGGIPVRTIHTHRFRPTLLGYLVDGMNFTPAGPSFEEMRDGILQSVANSGSGRDCLIWDAFAHYGVGVGAIGKVKGNIVVVDESFALPPECQ